MTQVFLSYAHEDRQRLEKSLVHLQSIFDDMGLKFWWDKALKGGEPWHSEIGKAIQESDIFVCYATPQYRVSTYIRDHELVAINDAYQRRDALVIPLLVEECAWESQFKVFRRPNDISDLPLGALPKDGKGKLKPVIDWSPHRKGWNAVRVQSSEAIASYLESRPRPPNIPAEMVPTEEGYRLSRGDSAAAIPPPPEREVLAQGLEETLNRLKPLLPRLHNASARLAEEFAAYDKTFHTDTSKDGVTWLWMKGFDLIGIINSTTESQLSEYFTPETVSQILHDLNALANRHAAFIMMSPEGVALTSRVLAAQTTSKADITRARLLLEALLGRKELYESETRALGEKLRRILDSGITDAPQIAETMVYLLASLSGFGKKLDQSITTALREGNAVKEVTLDRLAIETSRTLKEERTAILAFSERREELRRYVPWLESAIRGDAPKRQKRLTVEPSKEFNADQVREMILAGKAPPKSWVPHITRLDFDSTPLNDLTPLAGLTHLRRLDMDGTMVTDLSPLAGLKELKTLYIQSTRVSDLSPIAGLTELQTLGAVDTRISDLSPLSRLSKLEILYLNETLVNNISPISTLTNIRELLLSYNNIEDLSPISEFIKLERLEIRSTNITDLSPMRNLKNIESLDAGDNSISDISPVSNAANMRTIRLHRTNISDISYLYNLTDIKRIDLSYTPVDALYPLVQMMHLDELYIDRTIITDISVISNLENLSTLSLEGCQINTLPGHWPHLKEVNLYGCEWPPEAPYPGECVISPDGRWLGPERHEYSWLRNRYIEITDARRP